MLAEIITIGDELLIGQVIDTNSAWIAQKLNQIGIHVKQISSVSDDQNHILEALHLAQKRVSIVLLTGGLGPTKDDITKKTLSQYFNSPLVLNENVLAQVNSFFLRSKKPMLEANKQQAWVPQNCTVLSNTNGTAPGMWFEKEDCIFIAMPGVPFEMKYLMEEEVLPKLKNTLKLPHIVHQTILTAGLGESFLSEKIQNEENNLPKHIKLAYLPKLGSLRLRLSAQGETIESLEKEVQFHANAITKNIQEYVIAYEDLSIEQVILNQMKTLHKTLSTAESCTGGYIGHQITQHPGCSTVYLGGAISYSYELKENLLGVKPETLQKFGAVSEETVREMVLGALQNFKSDYAIAVSGIAGPDGATEQKPVGTICIAVANHRKTIVKTMQFGTKRIQNIERTAAAAFLMLFNLLKEESIAKIQ